MNICSHDQSQIDISYFLSSVCPKILKDILMFSHSHSLSELYYCKPTKKDHSKSLKPRARDLKGFFSPKYRTTFYIFMYHRKDCISASVPQSGTLTMDSYLSPSFQLKATLRLIFQASDKNRLIPGFSSSWVLIQDEFFFLFFFSFASLIMVVVKVWVEQDSSKSWQKCSCDPEPLSDWLCMIVPGN